jgi:hypothetical protein
MAQSILLHSAMEVKKGCFAYFFISQRLKKVREDCDAMEINQFFFLVKITFYGNKQGVFIKINQKFWIDPSKKDTFAQNFEFYGYKTTAGVSGCTQSYTKTHRIRWKSIGSLR